MVFGNNPSFTANTKFTNLKSGSNIIKLVFVKNIFWRKLSQNFIFSLKKGKFYFAYIITNYGKLWNFSQTMIYAKTKG